MKVGMIGLGKLGLPCAEEMARLHEVTGYDLEERQSSSINVVNNIREVVSDKDFVFIAVPTPHDPSYDGKTPITHLEPKDFDYTMIEEVLEEIGRYTSPNQTIVLISTVLPGTTRRLFSPKVTNYNLIYNPYFIAMGTVKEDFKNPEFMPIGTKDGSATLSALLLDFYRTLIPDLKFSLGTWEECEAMKIFYNTFISFKLSFVNMIQDTANRIGHMNVDTVTNALIKSDRRLLSPTYMKAGMGDGGPCHPRDNIALRYLAKEFNLGYDLFDAIIKAREGQAKNLAIYLASLQKDIILLGMTFKPNVALEDGSYSHLVNYYLQELGANTYQVDPLLERNEEENLNPKTKRVYLLCHDDQSWHDYPFTPGSTVVDPWRKLSKEASHIEVIHFGNSKKGSDH